MKRIYLLFLIIVTITIPCIAISGEIKGPEFKFSDNFLKVSLTLSLDESQINLIHDGIPEELSFYIDLFRRWETWPDEYITGVELIRTLKADTVKGEFIATSLSGSILTVKRFASLESMLKWSLNVNNITFSNNNSLEKGLYFIRVTIESHKRKLPKIIGYVLFFINDRDFKITKDSEIFIFGKN